MTSNLLMFVNDDKLRDDVKPKSMSRSEYESLIISLYNRYGDISIDEMKRKLKIRIAISNAINV